MSEQPRNLVHSEEVPAMEIGHGERAFPAGEETAHQIINSSTRTLRYLCMSTMIEPELVKYPDTNKIGVVAGRAPAPVFRAIFRLGGEPVDYWDGEP